jgi:hypothetical protein
VNGDGEVVVTDATEARRYEAHVNGCLAGVLAYRRTPDIIALVHTEVDEAYEGRSVGSPSPGPRSTRHASRACGWWWWWWWWWWW